MAGHHASRSSQRRQRETIRKAEKPDWSPAAPCAAKSRPRQQLTMGLDCGLASDLRGPDYLVNTHISGHLARTLTSRDLLLALAAVLYNADVRVMGSNPMRVMLLLLLVCLFCCCCFLFFLYPPPPPPALTASCPELGAPRAQWEGWDCTADLHPLHGHVFGGVALIR